MVRDFVAWGALLVCLSLAGASWGATPTRWELAQSRRWAAEHFRQARPVVGGPPAVEPPPGLVVLANHDRVLINGRPDGRLLKLGATEFAHGLICHAVSKIVVRLPGPGRAFRAVVGVDANAGGGSVVFSVTVGGRQAFLSGVMRGGEPGVPVAVDLGGASEFTIEADDAGDGINSDHADWAQPVVVLSDGTEVRVSDLPLLAPSPRPRRSSEPPFSFVYGGRHSDDLLPTWTFSESVERLGAQRTRKTQTYVDPATGFEVRCVVVSYADFPVVEWTLHLKNTGRGDTPIVEDLQALDTRFGLSAREFTLRHNVGSPCRADDYRPIETSLQPGAPERISAAGGRPTNSDLCYFSLGWESRGVIIALGWPGQWAADFVREEPGGARVVAGQEVTHFRLHPGEEVRTPLVALQFWGGDPVHAQNVWRQWMIAHNLPRPGGHPVPMHYGACYVTMQPRADDVLASMDTVMREKVPFGYWFIDAGWYPSRGQWWNVGTWEVDRTRFPRGVREVADRAHANGMKFVLWFEPERVSAGSWLAENRPEWILGGKEGGLVNLGNRDAWRWVLERMDALITSEGVDVYRQDFNIDPLSYWRGNDAEDRQGITEVQHVMGYLALWDELLRRHPGLYIDTCASGGRRNDLETLRRSVPLLRSDYYVDPVTQQAQTMGIAAWMPYYGSGLAPGDVYWYRSCIFPASRVGGDSADPNVDYGLLRRMIVECREVQTYMMGDFYPLTPYSLADDVWFAWQLDRPDLNAGVVQAFRRADCLADSVRLKLSGLDPRSRYTLTDFDSATASEMSGEELMTEGLAVTAPHAPAARILRYERRGDSRGGRHRQAD